jgi:hypothetical protein
MAFEDLQLTRLQTIAVDMRSRQVALDLANALASLTSPEPPSPQQRAEVAEAEAACKAADMAVHDYQSGKR